MTGTRLALLALLLSGCPRGKPPEAPVLAGIPRLPAPVAGVYDRLPATPEDRLVASLVGSHRWDGYLAGGAAGVALPAVRGTGGLEAWEVRERVWQAGYPYPIDEVAWFPSKPEEPPPEDLVAWLATVDPEADLGLVRARGMAGELWVGLVATPRADLGPIPRRFDEDDALVLPAVAGGRYTVADADGVLTEGALDTGARITLRPTGEWLVEVADDQGVLATFPVYVGMEPPPELLLTAAPTLAATPSEANDRALALLDDIRAAYALPGLDPDPVRDSVARELLTDPTTDVTADLTELGQPPRGAVHVWACEAATVEDCMSDIAWDPRWRDGLLSTTIRYTGIASSVSADKVRIRILTTEE